jgi:ribonucleoside-diphosphate reductase beta chain
MLAEAIECEVQFAADLLGPGISGMSLADMREYLQHVADRRLAQLGIEPLYGSSNPFAFMELQDVQELSNFFERRVSAYQVGVSGDVSFDDDF